MKSRAVPLKISRPGIYKGYSEIEYDLYDYVRHSQYVEMSDGCRIAVDYYVPTINGKEETKPLPVVFHLTPYLRSRYEDDGFNFIAWHYPTDAIFRSKYQITAKRYIKDGLLPTNCSFGMGLFTLLRYGYVIAIADVRGCGASFGCRVTTNSRREAQDGAEIIEWLAKQPFCDGKIGISGYSYTGQTQIEMISKKPEHLVCSFLCMTDYDKYDGWLRGGVPRAFGSQPDMQWGDTPEEIEKTVAAQVALNVPVDDDPDKVLLEQAIREHMGSLSQIEIFKTMLWRDSYLDAAGFEIWNEVSASKYKQDINDSGVAVYCVGGNYDVFRRDTVIMYENLTVPKKMLFGSWYHSEYPKLGAKWAVEEHRWFDYWLKGIDNGIMDEDPITVKVSNYNFDSRYHQGDGTGDFITADRWPVNEGRRDVWYPAEEGKLAAVRPEGVLSIPYRSEYGIATSCETPITTNEKGTGVDQLGKVFSSDVLEDDLEIIGHPMMTIEFSLEDPGWMTKDYDIDMFVTLSDYDPKTGLAFLISDGHIRSSLRAEGECPYDFLGLPWHPASKGSNEYLTPGEKYELLIDMMPLAYTVKKGHRLRLTVSNSLDRFYYIGRDAFEADPQVKKPVINIYSGGESRTALVIPNIYK